MNFINKSSLIGELYDQELNENSRTIIVHIIPKLTTNTNQKGLYE